MRINKYLAKCGVCSRREADRLIEGGEVEINGRVANLGDQIELFDQVKVKGCKIERLEKKVYVILNKPEGYICSSKGKKTVYDLVDCDERVFYVGRLDVASSGLLLLTNDGEMGERLMRPGNEHEREYEVKVKSEKREVKSEKSFDQFLEKLSQGVEIQVKGQRFKAGDLYGTLPAQVEQMGERSFRIVLTEGKNRQIRKMCEVLGYRVKSLKRVRIGNLTLGKLKKGEWRYLSDDEVRKLTSS